MIWITIPLFGFITPMALLYLWLTYAVQEYCVGCGKLTKVHNPKTCKANVFSTKLFLSFGLVVGGWLVLLFILFVVLAVSSWVV